MRLYRQKGHEHAQLEADDKPFRSLDVLLLFG
jgi:hypothetical protein